MSNGIKCSVPPAKLLDQLRLVGMVLGLAVAVAVLPLPWQLSAELAPRRVTTGSDLDTVLDAVTLGAASIAVWLLVCWIVVIGALTLAARVPGAVGAAARGALVRITPGFVRRTIAVGISVGAFAGVAAGSAPSAAGVPESAAVAVSTATANIGDLLPPTSHPLPNTSLAGPVARVAAAVAAGMDRVGDRAEPSTAVAEPTDGVVTQVSGTAARGVPSPTPAGHRILLPTVQPTSVDVDWPVHRPVSATAETPDLDWPTEPTVVVHRGDTLWSIAADRLGPHATDEQIDATWRSWYAANRAVIGDDPNLILPGQQLHAPPT